MHPEPPRRGPAQVHRRLGGRVHVVAVVLAGVEQQPASRRPRRQVAEAEVPGMAGLRGGGGAPVLLSRTDIYVLPLRRPVLGRSVGSKWPSCLHILFGAVQVILR